MTQVQRKHGEHGQLKLHTLLLLQVRQLQPFSGVTGRAARPLLPPPGYSYKRKGFVTVTMQAIIFLKFVYIFTSAYNNAGRQSGAVCQGEGSGWIES